MPPPLPDPTAPDADAVGPFEYRFTPRSRVAIRVARNAFAGWLAAQPTMDQNRSDGLIVAVSELCTNAVQHSSGGTGCVAIRGSVKEDAVVIEVEDDGDGFEPPEAYRPPGDVTAEVGRGLLLVRSLVDELEFRRTRDGMVVRCSTHALLRRQGDG